MAQLKKTEHSEIYTHDRGWGRELWIENIPEYCGKILELKGGKRCSLHFHMNKLETMYLAQGYVEILLIDPDTGKEYAMHLEPGEKIQIPRGQVHQIIALQDSRLFEFSTYHEEDDSYRVRKGD